MVADHGALAVAALRRHAKPVPLDHAAGADHDPDPVRPDVRMDQTVGQSPAPHLGAVEALAEEPQRLVGGKGARVACGQRAAKKVLHLGWPVGPVVAADVAESVARRAAPRHAG